MKKVKNRWLIAIASVGMHISIGSVYAWSVFIKPLIDQFGWRLQEVSLTFSIAILFLGLSAAFMGHFVEMYGPRKSGTIAAVFFGVGIAGSGLAMILESIYLLYLFYGVFGGIGLGVGYITPVSSLVKWFPDRRGMATGLAIMGFGFAAVLSSPVIARLVENLGLANTFFILGSIYFIVMLCSAQYLEAPPKGWMADENNQIVIRKLKANAPDDLSSLTANEAVKTKRFWALWLMLFINITCGIAIISVASPMGQEITGMTAVTAASMVGIMGLFNGLGRIGWASVSDYIGRPNVYTLFFGIQIVAFLLLPYVSNVLMFQVILFVILMCYGGGFASVPAYIGDLFGTKQLGAIHGYILTAWAVAGLIGPVLVSWIREATDSYVTTLNLFVVLFVIAFTVSLWIRADIRRISGENEKDSQFQKGRSC